MKDNQTNELSTTMQARLAGIDQDGAAWERTMDNAR
jgi:hypothetical protein